MSNFKITHFEYDLYRAKINGTFFEKIWHNKRIKYILRLLAKRININSPTILECGCNTGPMLIALHQAKYSPIGLDISLNNLKKAKMYLKENGLPDNTICLGNVAEIPFRSESFDVVLMIDLLEHTYSHEVIIKEIHRILKPGGKVVLAVPWPCHPVWYPFVKKMMSGRDDIDELPDNPLMLKDLKRIFVDFQLEFFTLAVFFSWQVAIFKKSIK